jgi:23S rRNA pseudouridine2605 synthase
MRNANSSRSGRKPGRGGSSSTSRSAGSGKAGANKKGKNQGPAAKSSAGSRPGRSSSGYPVKKESRSKPKSRFPEPDSAFGKKTGARKGGRPFKKPFTNDDTERDEAENASRNRPLRKGPGGKPGGPDKKTFTDDDSDGDRPAGGYRSRSFDKRPRERKPGRPFKKPFANADPERDEIENTTRSKPYRRPAGRPGTGAERGRSRSGGGSRNRYIANTGICSRREADELIAAGAVSVNGKVITEMGYKVKPEDEVSYGGQRIKKERMVYVLLNKPKDFITTTDDPENRRTVMQLVKEACRERIYPVGRLDRETTGVLLLTNDGELTKRLTHPSYNIKKIYHVELGKSLKSTDLHRISEGIELEDGFIKADEISYVGEKKNEIGIEIHSGRNRIIRRIFESLGYTVKKLDRVYFAGLTKKDLPRGRWRMLTEMEVNMLKMLTGSKGKKQQEA